jgi:Co/Zn/Cd efflux system component
MPEAQPMILIALLALAVNVTCLLLLRSEQDKGSHMKASYIFSANDVLANLGLIIAGVLVAQLNSPIPDWIIGFLIGVLAVSGAIRIMRLK